MNNKVCSNCFIDSGLISYIKNNAQDRGCTYCKNKDAKSLDFQALIDFMFEEIKKVYPPQPNLQALNPSLNHLTHVITENLTPLYKITERDLTEKDPLLTDVITSLKNKSQYWHVEKDKNERMIWHQWLRFSHNISYIDRYSISYEDLKLLAVIKKLINKYDLKTILEKGKDVFYRARAFKEKSIAKMIINYANFPNPSAARHQKSGQIIYTASLDKSTPEIKDILLSILGPPLSENIKNQSTRISPAGIPVFYCSTDPIVAIGEVALSWGKNIEIQSGVWTGDNIPIAVFNLNRDIPIIDFSKINTPSFFEVSSNKKERSEMAFLSLIIKSFSNPIRKDGREHTEYVPTQNLSNFLKNQSFNFSSLKSCPLGIKYPSVTNKGTEGKGFSYAFFIRRDDSRFKDIFSLKSIQTAKFKSEPIMDNNKGKYVKIS